MKEKNDVIMNYVLLKQKTQNFSKDTIKKKKSHRLGEKVAKHLTDNGLLIRIF